MYAVIVSGGKQYRVAPGQVVDLERLPGEAGESVRLDQVLLVEKDGVVKVGSPTVSGAFVVAERLTDGRDKKVIVFKKMRRKGYRRTRGHRQDYTRLRIVEIKTA